MWSDQAREAAAAARAARATHATPAHGIHHWRPVHPIAHQSALQRIGQGVVSQVSRFAKDTSGVGKEIPLHGVMHGDPGQKASHIGEILSNVVHNPHLHGATHAAMYFAHVVH